ncbi:MAG: 30S ribosomal protein S4 [Candidatus Hodgkinia cicadicola]
MSKRGHPKFKFDRRIGENLWGVRRSSVNRVQSAPGQHGDKPRAVMSEYCVRFIAKQKLKRYYCNLTESKFKKAFKKALKYKGNVSHNLIRLLEMRLDVLVYRACLAKSFRSARQLINHGHVLVNNRKVNICSFECKPGDVFRVNPSFVNAPVVKQAVLEAERDVPPHIGIIINTWLLDF